MLPIFVLGGFVLGVKLIEVDFDWFIVMSFMFGTTKGANERVFIAPRV